MNTTDNTQHHLGITPPISTQLPTLTDTQLNQNFIQTLTTYPNIYETPDQLQLREDVLQKLRQLLQKWATSIALEKGFTPEQASKRQTQVRTFGSYRLGVHNPQADIDTLCIAPEHCTRPDFFTKFPLLLKKDTDVTQLHVISDAFVPVIKLSIYSVPTDLLFVSLNEESIAEDINLLDTTYLQDLDEAAIRSINGCRVTEMILQLVPDVKHFQVTLRAIKCWARLRGIYSNVLGFFGGVNWAILVARVCQLYPNALSATLFIRFFRVFGHWKWPTPVLLKAVEDIPELGYQIWDPKTNSKDALHLMPIITPAYPCMNSSYNVSASTMRILSTEFRRGATLSFQLDTQTADWTMMFAPSGFFDKWLHYLRIDITALTSDAFYCWFGWIESRLRQLPVKLEQIDHVFAYPFGEFFDCSSTDRPYMSSCFIAIQVALPENATTTEIELTEATREFASIVMQWNKRIPGMDLAINYLSRENLPDFVTSKTNKRKRVS